MDEINPVWSEPADDDNQPWQFVITDPAKIRAILDIAGVVANVGRLVLTLESNQVEIKRDKNDDYFIIGDVK